MEGDTREHRIEWNEIGRQKNESLERDQTGKQGNSNQGASES